MKKALFLGIFAAIVLAFAVVTSSAQDSIVGVWQATDSSSVDATGPHMHGVRDPNLYIFTKGGYFSITSAIGGKDAFDAWAGKYEYKGGKLSLWPSVGNSPSIHEGAYWTFKVDNLGGVISITPDEVNGYPVAKNKKITLQFKKMD